MSLQMMSLMTLLAVAYKKVLELEKAFSIQHLLDLGKEKRLI